MQIKLSRALTHTLNSLPRGRTHPTPITNSCNVPWHHVTVDFNSQVLLCTCDGWLPIPVGVVDDFDSLDDIWNCKTAKFLQQDIIDKKFTWCAVEHCGILQRNIVEGVHTLSLNIDESCNLACPSCRRSQVMLDQGPEYNKKLAQVNRIMSWLQKFDRPIQITLSGNGDPFASKILRPLIQTYQPLPKQRFTLKTNGLLIKKLLDSSTIKKAINVYFISVDAGSSNVYEKVRRLGKWNVLLDNLEWLKNNKDGANVMLDFVVQKDNLDDMFAFAELCKEFGFVASYSALFDWGSWNSAPVVQPDQYTIQNGTFLDHDVTNTSHPDHLKFVTLLNQLRAKYPQVRLHNFFTKFFNGTR